MLKFVTILAISVVGLQQCHAYTSPTAAEYEAYQIIETISDAFKNNENDAIIFFMHKNLTYDMCKYKGDYETFRGYLANQEKSLVTVKFDIMSDDATITNINGAEKLKFTVNTEALYKTRDKVQGSAQVVAIKEPHQIGFKIINITQRCRILTKRHRLYRLFTYHDLYDY